MIECVVTKLLTTTITFSGEVLGNNVILEKKIVSEFLLRQLCAVKTLEDIRNPCPVLRYQPESIQSRPIRKLLRSS